MPPLIESQVHTSLRAYLRQQGDYSWPHHLTMARLVARALRLGRSALMQTSTSTPVYALSYLTPALLWQGAVVLVIPTVWQEPWIEKLIPQLQTALGTNKKILVSDRFPSVDFTGVLITSPQNWLSDRLNTITNLEANPNASLKANLGANLEAKFPPGIPTLIDGADDLEPWARDCLTQTILPGDWDQLIAHYPQQREIIRDVKIKLTKSFFDRPPNPYGCWLLDTFEQELIHNLGQFSQQLGQTLSQILWAEVDRRQGYFTLHSTPAEVATSLSKVWQQQPVVFMGRAMDLEVEATVYRQNVGLGGLTCLKFPPDPQTELIQLYLPDRLPLPNTPQFQAALEQQVMDLLTISSSDTGFIVILVEDRPLKQQMAAVMAGEFGSRVQMEVITPNPAPILVTGWQFWREFHHQFPSPKLLIIATLPIPSLENPLVGGQVAYYKQQRLDWFRLYLLPTALRELQSAIAPARRHQGIVAMLDSRVNHRSYGQQVLTALSPFAKINYLDPRLWELLS
jgi:ATP-dependent DNA helicase DinG